MTAAHSRGRGPVDQLMVTGAVTFEIHDEDGNLTFSETVHNIVTAVGDQLYASRGAGLTTSAVPTGMKLGTGATAAAKTGAGAALVTYLANSHQGFDATFPSVAGGVVTYKVTFAAGKATSAGASITEAVLVTDALADATSTAANTAARVLLSAPAAKQSTDTLTVTWTHTIAGS
ncbi:MAG: hypothetical protein ABI047_03130 [Jatrophihabitantaceae bacterium]